MQEQYDAIIIGSGAGGAPVAHRLVAAGKSVLLLEKGPLLYTQEQSPYGLSDFRREELLATGAEKLIAGHVATNAGASYFTSHVEPDLNDEPHVYEHGPGDDRITIEGYTAQVVGGGTQLYGAVSLRFSELDFSLGTLNANRGPLPGDPNKEVAREARDWPIAYSAFEQWYSKAEELVGLNGTGAEQRKRTNPSNVSPGWHYQTPLPPNPISAYAEEGMRILGKHLRFGGSPVEPYRTPLAVVTQDHPLSGRYRAALGDPRTGYVNRYGCPLGLKSSTWVSLLAPMRNRPEFELFPNCNVTHLEADGRRVHRVHFRDPSGAKRVARGKVVVVACSAVESVRLLQLSAMEDPAFSRAINPHGLLGKYFLTHCFGGAETVMPGRFDKTQSLDSDWATDACASRDFIVDKQLWAGGAIYNNTSDQALPISLCRTHGSQDMDTIWKTYMESTDLTGEGLLRFMDENMGTRLSVSFMANQVPLASNRIELHPAVRDKWNRPVAYIRKTWHPHDVYLMDVMAEQCRSILAFGGDPVDFKYPVEGFGAVYMAENARARIANHILGGARFGKDPLDSVLNPICKAWNFDNLFVTDGSFMPTSGGANPTLTIQANAFRVAEAMLNGNYV
jgi:choline dehydrogenase-like flavoprotein